MKHSVPKAISLGVLLTLAGCSLPNNQQAEQQIPAQKTPNPIVMADTTETTPSTTPTPESASQDEKNIPSTEELAGATPQPTPVSTPITEVSKTYSYNAPYLTPKGETPMRVDFIVKGGKVENFTLTGNEAHKISVQKQSVFSAAAKSYVIGKSIEELNALPSKLNGSSLTSVGFNKALAALKAEAL